MSIAASPASWRLELRCAKCHAWLGYYDAEPFEDGLLLEVARLPNGMTVWNGQGARPRSYVRFPNGWDRTTSPPKFVTKYEWRCSCPHNPKVLATELARRIAPGAEVASV